MGPSSRPLQTFHFIVICSHAKAVFVIGDSDRGTPIAMPMRNTQEYVWEAHLDLPANESHFSYFVFDERWQGSRAPFGSKFSLPGSWAAIARTHPEPSPRYENAN